MSTTKRAVVIVIATATVAFGLAAPANAEPGGDDSCPLAMAFLCRFLPVAPGLDHDIDLTQDSATINGDTLPQCLEPPWTPKAARQPHPEYRRVESVLDGDRELRARRRAVAGRLLVAGLHLVILEDGVTGVVDREELRVDRVALGMADALRLF